MNILVPALSPCDDRGLDPLVELGGRKILSFLLAQKYSW